MPKYHKIQRATVLALFPIASIASYFKPHLIPIAGLALIGVIAYDIICYLKQKTEVKDFGPEIERLKAENIQVLEKLQDIRNDASIGKLAETFRRK